MTLVPFLLINTQTLLPVVMILISLDLYHYICIDFNGSTPGLCWDEGRIRPADHNRNQICVSKARMGLSKAKFTVDVGILSPTDFKV